MSRRLALLLALLPAGAAAQVRSAAVFRVAGASADPAAWVGGDLSWRRPRWRADVRFAGAIGARRTLGAEGGADLRFGGGPGWHPAAGASLGFERPLAARGQAAGFGWAGAEFRRGGWSFAAGPAALVTSMAGGLGGIGSVATTRVRLGPLEVLGEVGQFMAVTGSPDGALQIPLRTDTGQYRLGSVHRFGHAVLGIGWRHGRFDLSGRVLRRSPVAPNDGSGWMAGVGVAPVNGLRLSVAAARAPVGPSLYLPFRQQLIFGLELTGRRVRPLRGAITEPLAAGEIGPAFAADFDPAAGLTTIRLRHPVAGRVELLADFTDWRPVLLRPSGPGVFEHAFALGPGVYLVNLRIDGGPLVVPAGLDSTADEFGGRVGVLVVR
jgi:hypothetical protein